MTCKQIKKYAMELAQLEQIRISESSTKEDKVAAEKKIMSLTNQILMFRNGASALLDIDTMCQTFIKKSLENQGE